MPDDTRPSLFERIESIERELKRLKREVCDHRWTEADDRIDTHVHGFTNTTPVEVCEKCGDRRLAPVSRLSTTNTDFDLSVSTATGSNFDG